MYNLSSLMYLSDWLAVGVQGKMQEPGYYGDTAPVYSLVSNNMWLGIRRVLGESLWVACDGLMTFEM